MSPGLDEAEKDFLNLADEDPNGVKRVFYVLLKLRRMPFRSLQEPTPDTEIPLILYDRENFTETRDEKQFFFDFGL